MATRTPPLAPQSIRSPRLLSLLGAIAAATLSGAFLIGILGMLSSRSLASDNWLVILFNINLRPTSTQPSALGVVSALDVALMLLFGIVMIALYPALSSKSRTWAAIALTLPFLGLPLFFATGMAGRSAVLLAGLISSLLALRARFGRPGAAYAGALASALLLFVGDFGSALFPPLQLLAFPIAIGYILWIVWLLLTSVELYSRSQPTHLPAGRAA